MESVFGGVFRRDSGWRQDTGYRVEGHTHNFDHVTYFAGGKWQAQSFARLLDSDGKAKLDADGQEQWVEIFNRIVGPGDQLDIHRENKHTFELLEAPGRYVCIYAHREPDTGDVVNEYRGNHVAYV